MMTVSVTGAGMTLPQMMGPNQYALSKSPGLNASNGGDEYFCVSACSFLSPGIRARYRFDQC